MNNPYQEVINALFNQYVKAWSRNDRDEMDRISWRYGAAVMNSDSWDAMNQKKEGIIQEALAAVEESGHPRMERYEP